MPAPIMVLTTTIVARKGPSFLCVTAESIVPPNFQVALEAEFAPLLAPNLHNH
jgi:hypothetical protein